VQATYHVFLGYMMTLQAMDYSFNGSIKWLA
jgi:hypothetical protein